MNNLKAYILLFIITLLLAGCDSLSGKKDDQNTEGMVARAGSAVLYKRDIAGLVTPGTPTQDSLNLINKFVENWIKEELFVQEASKNTRLDLSEIERKVANYRYLLISYEFQKRQLEERLDRQVSDEEIEAYYNENNENFILKQNIVRGRYITLPLDAPKKNDVKRWIKSNRPQDLEALKSYCLQFAKNYAIEDSTWFKFDDVIKGSPLNTIENKIQFLRRNRYVEEVDSTYLYLFKINEYKISDQASPLEFVRQDIENIIINKRKVALTKRLENEIYERAKENEDFEIYK